MRADGRHPRRVVVEKCKWDGSVAARERAHAAVLPEAIVWHVNAGTVRHKLRNRKRKILGRDQLWVGLPELWCVLCCYLEEDSAARYKLHAAVAPTRVERRLLRWVDLDLDLHIEDGRVELADEVQFCERVGELGYTRDVISGAWRGISELPPRYLAGEWPFDGWLEATRERVFLARAAKVSS
jgi:hypothetical protein